jgi:hypothetical protein
MNATRTVQSAYPAKPVPAADTSSARSRNESRPTRRDRDFGIGYGNSSGYAQDRCYAQSWAKTPFRCY